MGENDGNTTQGGVGGLDAVGAQPVQPVTTSPDQAAQPDTVDVSTADKPSTEEVPQPDATSDTAPDAAPVDGSGETTSQPAPRQQSDTKPNL